MRKFVAAISVLFISSMALAEPVKAEQPLTPKQSQKLREDVQNLAKAFGIDTRQAANNQKTEQNENAASPTMAKVADKALDMASGLISSVAATVEKAAPKVWSIMIRQQYAKAFGNLLLPWGLFLGTLVAFILTKKRWKNCCEHFDGECSRCIAHLIFKTIVPILALVITGIYGCVALSDSIMYLVNPDFYAIRDLLLMLLNKGQGL